MLCRLIYSSTIVPPFDFEDLRDILAASERNNPIQELTGVLVTTATQFLQVLEGPSDNVNELYRKLQRDSRHERLRLIEYTACSQRLFDGWAMRGVHRGLMSDELTGFLTRKYGSDTAGGLVLPDNAFLATSLLFDVAHADLIGG
jgi:hypothetical protein